MSEQDPTGKVIETEASHAAYVQQLLEELAQKDRELAETRVELEQLRGGKTWPPPPQKTRDEQDTDDLTCQKHKADLLSELQFMRQAFATMNSELGSVHRELAEYRPLVAKMTEFLQAGCCEHCPNRPPPTPAPPPGHASLSVVPKAASGGGE